MGRFSGFAPGTYWIRNLPPEIWGRFLWPRPGPPGSVTSPDRGSGARSTWELASSPYTRCRGARHPCCPRARARRRGVASRARMRYARTVIDTSPAANHELLRAMPPERRLEVAMGLTQTVRELALAGIHDRHPQADEHEMRVRLTVRLYGRAVAMRLFGAVPDDAV